MKKLLVLMLLLVMLVPVSVSSAAGLKPDAQIKVLLNGKHLVFDINPIQTQGTTLVQFTTIFKALGLSYSWDQETKRVKGFNDDLQLRLTLNDPIANVNGYNILLNAAPIAYQGKTLVPLRFVSEATGMKVTWKAETKTITIENNANSEPIEEPNLLYYTSGAEAGDSPEEVTSLHTKKATHPYGKETYTYNNTDFLGYQTELNFDFVYNELSTVSYYIGKNGLDDHYMVIFNDILLDLEADFGAPNEYSIYEEYGGAVDWDIPVQLLYDGIESGEYYIKALWDLPQAIITMNLYTTDAGNVQIETVIFPL